MSSTVSEAVGTSELRVPPASKRKRPCDACRKRKVRCDGDEVPGDRCSNCIAHRSECTYLEDAKKRITPEAYIKSLEHRLEQVEKLLRTARPDADFSKELSVTTEVDNLVTPSVGGYTPDGDDEPPSSDDEFSTFNFTSPRPRPSIGHGVITSYGKSSGPALIRAIVEMKTEFQNPDKSRTSPIGKETHPMGYFLPHRRPEFWKANSWRDLGLELPKPHYHFPDPDLLPSLVDNYFKHMNLIFPLLHRPTFEQSLADDLHHRDTGFGGVVLLVAAVGARFSDDPRVYVPGTDPTHSVGSMWFYQVKIALQSFFTLPSLHDLQIYCLYAMFLLGSAAPQCSWTVIGAGIRLSQAVGTHRKRVYGKTLTVADELWKRAFWVLFALDRTCSSGLGRSCAIQDEDFDLEYPVECDDEYWNTTRTSPAFTQPPGEPSKISFFVSYLELDRILGSALRTIYSTKKQKFPSSDVGVGRRQKSVSDLDSALNKWFDSVPDHLRWDPHREDTEFLQQSAVLHAKYYDLQILVHRPFVSSSQKHSPLSFPSLVICMNAARSCSRLAKHSRERLGPILHHITMPAFTSGVILLFNIWGGKWAGMNIDPTEEMEDVHRCMSVLSMAEKSWNPAGRLWDILRELAHIGDLPLSPDRNTGHSNKRQRDLDSPMSVESTGAYTSSPNIEEPRVIAGSRRVSHAEKTKQRRSTSQENLTPSTSDIRELIDQQDLGNSSRYTAWKESAVRFDSSTAGIRERPVVSVQGQNPMDQGTYGNTTAPARGGRTDPGAGGTPLFPIDPLLYGDIMHNFGYAGATVSGVGQQAFHDSPDNGSGDTAPSQRQPGPGPRTQQQTVNPLGFYNDGRRVVVPNPEGLTMWTNAPHGFEWEGWGTYAHNFSNMTRQH